MNADQFNLAGGTDSMVRNSDLERSATPGPWRAQVDPRDSTSWKPAQWVAIWAGNTLIATYDTSYAEYPASDAENAANARLMAAAPALLEALKTAEALLYAHGKPIDPAITAAISRATQPTGEQQ